MVVGFALIPSGIAIYVVKTVAPLFNNQVHETPTTYTQQLAAGTYDVYEQSPFLQSGPTLPRRDVSISPASGITAGNGSNSVSTLVADGVPYLSQFSFDVVTPGDYTIAVASPQGESVSMFVAPSVGSALARNLGWLGLPGGGALLFVVGLLVLIVRGVQRSRLRPRPVFYAPHCANGHQASVQDRFCHTCGAPVYAAAPTVVPQR